MRTLRANAKKKEEIQRESLNPLILENWELFRESEHFESESRCPRLIEKQDSLFPLG